MNFKAKDAATHFRVSREFARRQMLLLVIPSEVEKCRCVSLKVSSRIPRLPLRMAALGRLFLLPEAPAPMCHTKFADILGIERDVRVAAHRRHQRTLRNRHVVKDAAVL